MRKAGWYVIQVQTGKEQAMCQLIERLCAEADLQSDADGARLLEECFSPRFKTRHKFKGEWQDVEKLLLPGYVIAATIRPDALSLELRKVRELTKLLAVGETFVPLHEDERTWIETFTREGDRTVPMSIADKEGDTLVVTEGPLKGREALITRVNRKKCLAFLELHVAGKKVTTQVGLGIVNK